MRQHNIDWCAYCKVSGEAINDEFARLIDWNLTENYGKEVLVLLEISNLFVDFMETE